VLLGLLRLWVVMRDWASRDLGKEPSPALASAWERYRAKEVSSEEAEPSQPVDQVAAGKRALGTKMNAHPEASAGVASALHQEQAFEMPVRECLRLSNE